jgi:hypothetical protein
LSSHHGERRGNFSSTTPFDPIITTDHGQLFNMAYNATSFTSPLAERFAAISLPPQVDYVVEAVAAASFWTWAFTILAIAVAYDQCELPFSCAPGITTPKS